MKNVIMTLIAALSLQAHAMSPVPYQAPVNGLVQLRIGGGMPVPGGLRFREVVITHAGEVKIKEATYGTDFNDIWNGGEEREYVLGQVKPADLAALEKAAAGITGGGLSKVKGPECMDAPGYSYGVIQNGIIVNVYSRFGCRDSQLKDKRQRPAALSIKNYLDQWNSLR